VRAHLAGIEASPTTVVVSGARLRVDLHSPLPDGSITDYKDALNTVGGLAREPAGVIRTWECLQLHMAYSWHTILRSLDDLQTRW
jgi:hypothetical protein